MTGGVDWRAVRELFDEVCELPEAEWRSQLQARTADPRLVEETLSLLQAQTVALGDMQRSLDAVFAGLDAPVVEVGTRLGPWRLSRLLATGGMGLVFLAERADARYRRQVAIKLIRHAFDPALAQRLQAESQILADLQHPNIAHLYDVGVGDQGQPYLVMEYVDGQPLDAACRSRGLSLEQVLRLFIQVSKAVQAAHAQGVVHCDLKPANVLVRSDGEPVLLDFGIARLHDDAAPEAGAYSTPRYASPERLAGRTATVAGDIYSLGVVLDELVLAAVADGRVPGDLRAVIDKARAAAAVERYASADALAEDLDRFLGHRPVRARRSKRLHRARLFLRRQWRGAVLAGVLVVLAGVFVQRLAQARSDAESSAEAAASIADFLVAAFDAADPALRRDRPMSAREVLDLGARRIEQDLTASPLVRARLQATLGRAYQNLGQPREAESLLRTADAALAAAAAPAAEVASVRVALAQQMIDAHRHAEAVGLVRQALRLLDQHDDVLVRVRALNALGRAHAAMEQYTEAEDSLGRARTLAQTLEGRQAEAALMATLSNLGAMYRSRGQLERSEQALREALAVAASDPLLNSGLEYQRALRALSYTALAQGRGDEAMRLAERAFALTRRLFGTESSYTAAAEAELAGQYLDLGRYPLSEQHFLAALATSARVDGSDSLAYAGKVYAMGIMEEARGDHGQAEQRYRQALQSYQRVLGIDHADTLDVEMVLARLLLRSGRTVEAEPLLRRVGQVWRRSLPAESQQLVALQLVELEWLTRDGQLKAARQALAAFVAEHPQPTPSLALRQQMQQALLAQRLGEPEAAVLWGKTVATFERFYGADSTATAKWRIPLAEALLDNGDVAAAAAQVERARPLLQPLSPHSEFLRRLAVLEQRLERAGVGERKKIAQAR